MNCLSLLPASKLLMSFDPIPSSLDNEENEVKIVELLQYEHVLWHLAFMPSECDVS
jgi:hypothetical protein